MEDVLLKIKFFCAQNDTSVKAVLKQAGQTEQGFYKSIKAGSMKISTLRKIAEVLNVGMVEFFNDEPVHIDLTSTKHKISHVVSILIEVCNYNAAINFDLENEPEFSNKILLDKTIKDLFLYGKLAEYSQIIESKTLKQSFKRIEKKLENKLRHE